MSTPSEVFDLLNEKMKEKMGRLKQELHFKHKSELVKVVYNEHGKPTTINVLAIKNDAGLWIELADIQKSYRVAMGLKKQEQDKISLPAVMVYTKAQGSKYSIWICDDDMSESSNPNQVRTYHVSMSCSNLEMKVGMCLSGGGYRASLFHVGALRRMNQLGLLRGIDTFSSVSGGSLTNAVLAAAWSNLQQNDFSDASFEYFFRQPVLRIATEYNMVSSVFFSQDLKRLLRFSSDTNGANDLANRYIEAEEHVYQRIKEELKGKYEEWGLKGDFKPLLRQPLNCLPNSDKLPKCDTKLKECDQPQFVFCGTDFRDGRAFYFTHDAVGKLKQDTSDENFMDISKEEAKVLLDKIKIGEAVAASSAYPVAFHPLMVKYEIRETKAHPLNSKDPQKKYGVAAVTDGGLFDNLGMDVVKLPCTSGNDLTFEYKDNQYVSSPLKGPHRFIFVSDGGGIYDIVENQGNSFPPFTAMQVISCMGSQVNKLRTNWIRGSYRTKDRGGALWQLNDIWELYHKEKFRRRIEMLAQNCGFNNYEQELKSLATGPEFTSEDEVIENVREMLRSLTSVRTDLDAFTHRESKAIEVMGYYLTSIQLQNDEMIPIWKYKNPDGAIPRLPQCHEAYNMNFKSVISSIQKSDAGYLKNKFNRLWSKILFEKNEQGEIKIEPQSRTAMPAE